jgi:putative tricarboxylic transport membrane protein
VVGGGLQDFVTQVEAKKLRIIAVASPERLPGVDAPTLRELGHDIVFANWRGVSVHKNLDEGSAAALVDLFKRMTQTPRWKKIMADRGWLDLYLPEKEYQAFIAEETRIARDILAELGIAPK